MNTKMIFRLLFAPSFPMLDVLFSLLFLDYSFDILIVFVFRARSGGGRHSLRDTARALSETKIIGNELNCRTYFSGSLAYSLSVCAYENIM